MLQAYPRTQDLLTRCKAELEARKQAEKDKALKKYGEEGLAPLGNPELDTLDYQINELVGLFRYTEMNVARLRILQGTMPEVSKACREGIHSLEALIPDLTQHTLALIGVRQRLLDKGLHLGRREVFNG